MVWFDSSLPRIMMETCLNNDLLIGEDQKCELKLEKYVVRAWVKSNQEDRRAASTWQSEYTSNLRFHSIS